MESLAAPWEVFTLLTTGWNNAEFLGNREGADWAGFDDPSQGPLFFASFSNGERSEEIGLYTVTDDRVPNLIVSTTMKNITYRNNSMDMDEINSYLAAVERLSGNR